MSDKNYRIGYDRADKFLNSDEFKTLLKTKLKTENAKPSTRDGIRDAVSDLAWNINDIILETTTA